MLLVPVLKNSFFGKINLSENFLLILFFVTWGNFLKLAEEISLYIVHSMVALIPEKIAFPITLFGSFAFYVTHL